MKKCPKCKTRFKPYGNQKFCDACRRSPRYCEHCRKPFIPVSQNDTLRFCSTICRDDNYANIWAKLTGKQRRRKGKKSGKR